MFKLHTSFQILIVFFTVIFVSQCNAQKNENQPQITVNTKSQISRPKDEAKIETIVPDYEIRATNLEYLQTLPMLKFQFIFETKNNLKMDLPDDVTNILNSHWKKAIEFTYKDTFERTTAQGGYDRDMAWMSYCEKTKRELQKLSIDAPNGRRKISQTEATELYANLNEQAGEVIRKAEKVK